MTLVTTVLLGLELTSIFPALLPQLWPHKATASLPRGGAGVQADLHPWLSVQVR